MTDTNEDRLEGIKNKKVYEFMYLAANQNDFTEDDRKWLIEEVERLLEFQKSYSSEVVKNYKRLNRQIDSLTKENAELKAGHKKAIEEVRELAEAKGALEAKNAKLRDRLKWYKSITDADWETLKEFSEAVARGDK